MHAYYILPKFILKLESDAASYGKLYSAGNF